MLFSNHTDGLAMYQAIKAAGLRANISPTPRELSVCCGIALLLAPGDVEAIKALAAEKKLAYIGIEMLSNTFDNTRHKYG